MTKEEKEKLEQERTAGGGTPAQPEGGAQEQAAKKSRRDMFREGFASRHPDIDMNDEEAYYGALDDEYNAREEELGRHRDNNKKLNKMFMENPNAAYFMNDLIDGKEQMGVALMRQFGETFKEAVDDPTEANVKAFADALDAHAAKIKEDERLQDEFEKNADASEATIEDWAAAHNATPEQIDAVREFINQQFSNLIVGKISPELLDFAYKGLNYDNDVAAAEENGAAQGRNERIQEKLRKGKGDGVPSIQGGAKAKSGVKKDGFLANAGAEDPWVKAKREKY